MLKLEKVQWNKISLLTHVRSMLHSYRSQPSDLQCKSVDWFLDECNIRLIYKWIDWFLYECNIDLLWVNNRQVEKQPPELFYKKGVLKHFAKLIGKHVCQSLFFDKVGDLRSATLLKRCFPVNFVKLLRTSFLQNTSSQKLLLQVLVSDQQ